MKDDIESVLPALNVLIDSAIDHDAYVSYRRGQIDVNTHKLFSDQKQWMRDMQRQETRQKVIRQYNDLIVKQKIFRIKSKYLETARINQLMAEKEFLNGVIPVTEYSRLYSITSQAEENYESALMDFKTDYMLLEELTGMKFKLNLNNP